MSITLHLQIIFALSGAKTALPIRQIVSEIIVQAENLIDIEDANEEREED